MLEKKITFDSFIRMVLGVGIIIGALMLIERLSGVLLPFFIAWLIAYLLYPLVKFFQYKLRLRSRIIAIICALLTLIIVGGGILYLLLPPAIKEFSRVQDLLTIYFADGIDSTSIPKVLSKFHHPLLLGLVMRR